MLADVMEGESMHRRLIVIVFLVVCLCSGITFAGADGENLLVNPDFELTDAQGNPSGWYRDAWNTSEGYTVYSITDEGMNDSHCVAIHNIGENDARFAQRVSVTPDTLYRLSGWIRADRIADSGWGANLSIEGVYVATEGLYDTNGEWNYVEMYGITGSEQKEITVFVRLGGYSGESVGVAAFDQISLCEVEAVPSGKMALPWYQSTFSGSDTDTEDSESGGMSSRPLLVLVGILYLVLCLWVATRNGHRLQDRLAEKREKMPVFCVIGLVLACCLQWILSAKVTGYPVDINCFLSWGHTILESGPAGFYQATSFCDYPPGYMLILWVNSWVTELLSRLFGGNLPEAISELVLLKSIPCTCGIILSILVYKEARRSGLGVDQSGVFCLLAAFQPVWILNSACWGQVDIVLTLVLCIVVIESIRFRWDAVLPLFVLSFLLKPQALMLGFLGLVVLIVHWFDNQHNDRKRILRGIGFSAIVAAVVILPFALHQSPGWLLNLYAQTFSSYAHATVNTANLYYLFSLNWASLEQAAPFGIELVLAVVCAGWGICCYKSHQKRFTYAETIIMAVCTVFFILCGVFGASLVLVGYGAMAMAFLILLPMYIRARKIQLLPLLGGVLFILLYVFGIKMHERYLFPALAFLMLALVYLKDRRLLLLIGTLTLGMFVNEGIVLDNALRLGSEFGHLNPDTELLAKLVAILHIGSAVFALCIVHDHCLTEKEYANTGLTILPRLFRKTISPKNGPADVVYCSRLQWNWKECIGVLSVTIVYSVLALINLGSTRAPQTTWVSTSSEESIILDLGEYQRDFSMLYYCEVSYHPFEVETSPDAQDWSEPYTAEMDQGQCFRWKYLMPSSISGDGYVWNSGNTYQSVQKLSGRYVKITARQIGLRLNEVIFRKTVHIPGVNGMEGTVSGETIPYTIVSAVNAIQDSPLLSDPERIHDEPDSLQGEPGWYNSTYFDEIYHARTAYEHFHGLAPYETTHPPLGKVIMSWGIALFGMTPFGWRFMGALAGILMLPVMYALGRQLTRKRVYGFIAMILMSLECMHYTQTRIATIDSFPVLFILCAYLFMLRFMQQDLLRTPLRKLFINLAFSGFFMGCAVASKWIGVYAGIGLAVLFFWTLLRYIRFADESRKKLKDAASMSADERKIYQLHSTETMKRLLVLCAACIPFFVVIPLSVYLLSYIPYFRYQHVSDFGTYLQMVWKAQQSMLNYHGTPRLGMDHPFYSPWYEWPVNAKPMYYAMAYYMPAGISQAIFCFGNTAVLWGGLLGLATCFVLWCRNHIGLRQGSESTLHWIGNTLDIAPAYILISFMAQFLPWVLVPRGTYIYHYFASIPFLILSITLLFNAIPEKLERWKRVAVILYLLLVLFCFVFLYPYASGIPVSVKWLEAVKPFLNVYYALPYGS